MRFKSRQAALEYPILPRVLKAIAQDADNYCSDHFGKELIVTRILEEVSGESGVHQDQRAIDFRGVHKGVPRYSKEQVEELLDHINKKYPRKDGYLVLIYHGNPAHFHMQIPVKWADSGSIQS